MISEQTTFQNTPKWRLSDQYFKKKMYEKMANYRPASIQNCFLTAIKKASFKTCIPNFF